MPKSPKPERVQIRLHPRVFESLGTDLVTSDYVALTELVKNAYDAFATRAEIRFGNDPERGQYLELLDDGHGMSRETVENVWCVVATPFRKDAPVAKKGKKTRRVSGEKGLGRLSTARLGDRLEMVTSTEKEPWLKVSVYWPDLSNATSLNNCTAEIVEQVDDTPDSVSGTRLRIFDLRTTWTPERVDELRDHLSRLVSPFSEVDDFGIWLYPLAGPIDEDESDDENEDLAQQAEAAKIDVPKFLTRPKYRLTGKFTATGDLNVEYEYEPVAGEIRGRSAERSLGWDELRDSTKSRFMKTLVGPNCGPFDFEVRGWDIAADDVTEIADQFEMKKSLVRESIRAHKGISVYRDGILVLPKSDSAKDWLGLDLRRVSELGTRLSTSQIIGYVGITAEGNPRIRDTSDRERLVHAPEVVVFEEVIRIAVAILEGERLKDRLDKGKAGKTIDSLLGKISAESVNQQVRDLAAKNGTAKEAIPIVRDLEQDLKKTREEIERRFVYYSRLATIGTLAEMVVHEVRNKTTVVNAYLEHLRKLPDFETLPQKTQERHTRAADAITSLDQLAETFLPLASRSFGRGKRVSVVEDRIAGILTLLESAIKQGGIEVRYKAGGSNAVAIDPGELDAVILNLINNAIYWVGRKPKSERVIEIQVRRLKGTGRLKVGVHDSGPGVPEDDWEKIFWPGVTRKPGGIGMGLTIASEIVDAYEGKMALVDPGVHGGASFEFDLPLKT